MQALTFLNHVLNFLAPAAFLSVLLALAARLWWRKSQQLLTAWEQVLLNLVWGAVILGASLVLWGVDGRLLTYTLLVVLMATCQWLMVRGWRGGAA